MPFWSKLIGGGVKEAGEGIKTALEGAGGIMNDLRTALTGVDVKKQDEIMQLVLSIGEKIDAAQSEVNKIEAASSSFFVAGWRPALGWTCVLSLFLYYIPRFIIGMTMWVIQVYEKNQMLPLPEMGIADILGLTFTLLGASGIRAWEKKAGVAR